MRPIVSLSLGFDYNLAETASETGGRGARAGNTHVTIRMAVLLHSSFRRLLIRSEMRACGVATIRKGGKGEERGVAACFSPRMPPPRMGKDRNMAGFNKGHWLPP